MLIEPIRNLFSRGVVVKAGVPGSIAEDVLPAELEPMAGVHPRRHLEFVAGRSLARQGLRELGVASFVLLSDSKRAPIWPAGISGSITHKPELCVVVVAPMSRARSLGIGAEPEDELKTELWKAVLDSQETAAVARLPDPGVAARIMFSAKESIYKCQYPITRQYLGFHDVHLEMDWGAWRFTCLMPESVAGEVGGSMTGSWCVSAGHIVTAVEFRG